MIDLDALKAAGLNSRENSERLLAEQRGRAPGMLIALDYDGTYTADPDLWQAFIVSARARGHQVFVVTMRHDFEGDDVMRQLHGKVDRIVFTSRRAKRPHMVFLGHRVQIWIDDQPHWVEHDAADAGEDRRRELQRQYGVGSG